MYGLRQLWRSGVKSGFGIVLLMLAGLLLCLAAGQFWAAKSTLDAVEQEYTTVAVVTGRPGNTSYDDTDAVRAGRYLHDLSAQQPSFLLGEATAHLVSGFAEDLRPLTSFYLYGRGWSDSVVDHNPDAPYNYAVLEIELTDIANEEPESDDYQWRPRLWTGKGKILHVFALNGDYRDPTGWDADLLISVYGTTDEPARQLEPGKRYLVLASDYRDKDWEFRCSIKEDLSLQNQVDLDPMSLDLAPEHFHTKTIAELKESAPHEAELLLMSNPTVETATYYEEPTTGLRTSWMADAPGGASMENTQRVGLSVNAFFEPWTTVEYEVGSNVGTERTIDFTSRFSLPFFQELTDESAETILETDPTWRNAMESIKVSNHSVPVLAVNRLEGMADFASGAAVVTEGRRFTETEYADGAPVCIISETLAQQNGLSVGDKLSLSMYEVENDLPITFKNQDQAYNPRASFYVPENGFAQETEYAVIALYRQQDQWVSSPTSFTPNTVFVPEKSVTCRMVGGEQGVWLSTILRNGTIEKLEKKLAEQGLSGTVTYYDQGYSEIRENLSSYYRIAQIVLLTGLALWVVVLAVFLALFPLQRGKDARRMWTLGVPQKRIFLHIWGSDLFLCIIGTILALAVSLSAMGWAMRQLQGLSRTNLELDVAPGQTVVLCLAALLLEAAILALCAMRVAKKAGGQS